MIKYKQSNPWGCGLYAVANACNLNDFITEERLELSKSGNRIGQLSQWLKDDGHQFYIDVLYYNHLGKKLPRTSLYYRPLGDEIYFLPILINVRFSDDGKNHMVGGKISKDGTLYLYDSLQDEIVKTSLQKLNMRYHNVFGLFVFVGLENGNYCFI